MTAIGVFPFAIIALSFWIDGKYLLFAFVPGCLLMASAALFLGGQGITPPHLMLVALMVACMKKEGALSLIRQLLTGTVAGLSLLLLTIYGAMLALFYPRLFAGSTYVNGFGPEAPLSFLHPPPLEPSSANVTQTIYMLGSIFTFFAVLALCRRSSDYRQLGTACLAAVIVNIAFASADLATYYTGTTFLLDGVHNGNYVLRTSETAVLGLKRISGSFTETSAFSGITLGLFAFSLHLWLRASKRGLAGTLTLIQIGLLALSTSSTGLGGLAVVLPVSWLVTAWRFARAKASLQEAGFVLTFPLLVLVLGLAALLFEPLHQTSVSVVQALFLDKSQSESGIERLMLNAQAITNFSDSHGFGVGFGSVRASSFALAVIAAVGLPGLLMFMTFFACLFFSATPDWLDRDADALRGACRAACFAFIVAGCISGTSTDLNLMFFVFAAGAYWPQTFVTRRSRHDAWALGGPGGPRMAFADAQHTG